MKLTEGSGGGNLFQGFRKDIKRETGLVPPPPPGPKVNQTMKYEQWKQLIRRFNFQMVEMNSPSIIG